MSRAANKLLILFLSLPILINPTSGMTLTVTPENPVAGDEITIRGTASPDAVLQPSITFKKDASVADGKYEYRLYGIKIPSGQNNFAVTARNTENLNIRVKVLLWWTRSADAVSGTATVSQGNVPPGTYDIRIDGDAADGASSVSLTITASSKITADSSGNFEYKYASSGIPPGDFTLKAGGVTRTITLSEAPVRVKTTANPVQPPENPATRETTPAAAATTAVSPAATSPPVPADSPPVEVPGFGIWAAIIALATLVYRRT